MLLNWNSWYFCSWEIITPNDSIKQLIKNKKKCRSNFFPELTLFDTYTTHVNFLITIPHTIGQRKAIQCCAWCYNYIILTIYLYLVFSTKTSLTLSLNNLVTTRTHNTALSRATTNKPPHVWEHLLRKYTERTPAIMDAHPEVIAFLRPKHTDTQYNAYKAATLVSW